MSAETPAKTLLALAKEHTAALATYERLTKERDEAQKTAREVDDELVRAFLAAIGVHNRSFYAWEIAPLIQKLAEELSK